MRTTKTYLLLAGLTALFGVIGLMLGGPTGMLIALGLAVAMNVFGYYNSDKMVLRMYNAQQVDPNTDVPLLRTYYSDVSALSQRAGLPMPAVYVIESDQPNAFATGRDPAHVKNRDTLTMTITATLAGAISSLANFAMFFGGSRDDEEGGSNIIAVILMAILAPIAAMLVQMAISRNREYEADRVGGEISGDPESLARALKKIEAYAQGTINYDAERNPASAHMFIINPLHGKGMDNLFSTHPATENRVKALIALSQSLKSGGRPAGETAVPTVR